MTCARRLVCVIALAAACGPPPPPGGRIAAFRPETLEAQLASTPPDPAPGPTLARARLLRALGRQAEAVTQIETSLDGARGRLDWRAMSDLWRELGDIEIEMARPQDALDTYAKRLTNAKSLDATRDRAFAQVDMAYAFAYLAQWTPAQHALEDAEVLARSDLEQDGATLEKMAYVREKLLAREVAIELFDKARAVYQRSGDVDGEARAAIAKSYLVALERESSAPLDASLDALASRARDPEARVRLLRYRGEAAYLFDHQYAACGKLADQASPLAEHRGIHALAKAVDVLASVCAARTGDVPRAIAAAQRAVAFSEDEWQTTSVPSARQAAGFEALLLYRHILSLDVRLPERERVAAAFEVMEKARGRAHVDAAVRGGAQLLSTAAEVPPLLALNKHELEAHVAALDKEIMAGKDDHTQLERRRDALWALDDVKAAIAYHNPLITRMHAPRAATLAHAKDLLDDKTMLLAYLMTNDQVVAIAVTTTGERLFVVDGGPTAIAAKVGELREQALSDPHAEMALVRTKTGELYQQLLAPVKDMLDTHERVIVLPHGALATFPFEALTDDSGRFVVENHVVRYAQSATLALDDLKAKPSGERTFVGLGDPVYDWAAFKAGRPEGAPADARGARHYIDAAKLVARRGGTRAGLERLPGTARELRGVAPLFGADAKLYLRDQATEENVKAGILAKARIIHIASHGLFETDYQALALTMRPEAQEDGLLLPGEIAELKLDADLVVLSACETGRAHEVLAEPVSGLALALRTAGARRLIVTQWEVDDDATAELMKAFYVALVKDGKSYATALADAKRKLVAAKKWQHPFYWAPFVLVGG